MKRIILSTILVGIALIFSFAITHDFGKGQAVLCPTCWDTHTESFGSQDGSGNSSSSSSSEQQSGAGESASSNQTRTEKSDGSSDEHDEAGYDDGKGSKGLSGSTRTDTHKDPDGTRKVHHEEVVRENGKCEIVSWDDVYDKNNNIIKKGDRVSKPCDLYSLEMKLKGNTTLELGEVTWGPNLVIIPLQRVGDDEYQGSTEATLTSTIMGECSGVASFPGTFEVTAKEDRLNDSLEVMVVAPLSMSMTMVCPDAAGSSSMPPAKGIPLSFTLTAEEGAEKVYSMDLPGGNLTYTFTLRVNPQGDL